MTDRYANIRRALALLDSGDVYKRALGHATLRDQCHPDTIRALVAERDALAAALTQQPEAQAGVAHATASKDAEIEALRDALKECHSLSVARWRRLLAAEAENERLREQLRLATVDQAIAEAEASDAHAENKRLQESLVALEQEAGRG